MVNYLRNPATAVLLALVLGVSACSSSDPEAVATGPGGASVEPTDEGSEGADGAVEAESEAPAGGGGLTVEDAGTGTLTLDGVVHPDLRGECEISRLNGREDVGDLMADENRLIVAVDNAESQGEAGLNFVLVGSLPGFSVVQRPGTIDGVEYVGEKGSLGGTREIATVAFSGTMDDDGSAAVAELVCIIQNAF